jgi:hypothetical protein
MAMTCQAWAWDPDTDEESAGGSFAFQFNPSDEVYGISFCSGSWIRNTPLFGDFFVTLFQNGIEDATYSGIGMTIRVMPHWKIAPFVGIGGSYNYSLSEETEDEAIGETTETEEDALLNRGDSYWAWHGEGGVRLWTGGALSLLEVSGRYTINTLEGGDRDYWFIGLSVGTAL